MTWNSGVRLVSRTGWTSSTTRSNGTSWCANASSTVSRTPPRKSAKGCPRLDPRAQYQGVDEEPDEVAAISARSRPEVTVPTAMSVSPLSRAR